MYDMMDGVARDAGTVASRTGNALGERALLLGAGPSALAEYWFESTGATETQMVTILVGSAQLRASTRVLARETA